ncbi:MAG: ABC transporter permease [Gemmatimonadota bacterium]|nr:ABC transporter permease [Gemmatimonadota bacterium]MDE2985208.1 ABC transporter permease [Gemmatimonadota bacterium]
MRSRTRLSWFLARRYLASRSGGRFLSFITWIALGGITVGVTALVVVIGVMTGMQNELREKILGSTPHIRVVQAGSSLRLDDWEQVVGKVEGVDGVVSAAPVVGTQVALVRSEYAQFLALFGVDLEADGVPVTSMEDSLRSEYLSLEREPGGLTPVVLGSGIAGRMSLYVGDTVSVVAAENIRYGPNGEALPRTEDWVVSGVFSTGMYEYDSNNGYAAMGDVQDLLDLDARMASWLGVRVEDPWDAQPVADAVREALGGWPYVVDPWTQTNRQLFSALKLEKLAMGVIVSLIIFVAACNIVSTLVMVVVNRTREIGILKAMGLTRRDTLRAFVFQGLWIGVIGTTAGLVLGFILAVLIEQYGLIPIPPDIYFVDRLPVSISLSDVLWICGVSLLICLLATIYPARQASGLQPVEAIRHE